MKKFLSIIICLTMLNSIAFATDTSKHDFDLFLPAEDIPFGGGEEGGGSPGGGGGLSGGAVTGIVLGSIGGIALLGGLGWALKPYFAKGQVCSLENSAMSMCLEDATVSRFKSQNLPYLSKALDMNKLNNCPKSRYILIPDSEIKNDTVKSICIEIPQNMGTRLKVVITQISNPYQGIEFKTELYVNAANQKSVSHIALDNFLSQKSNGVMQMMGEITRSDTSKSGAIVVSVEDKKQKNMTQNYAYLVEFSGF